MTKKILPINPRAEARERSLTPMTQFTVRLRKSPEMKLRWRLRKSLRKMKMVQKI